MNEKAISNLDAAKVLVQAHLFDSAASRAYYAIYLAGWSWLERQKERPPIRPDGLRYWPHISFSYTLLKWGGLREIERDDFDYLQSRRVQADYFVDPVNDDEAQQAVEIAERLTNQLLGEDFHAH